MSVFLLLGQQNFKWTLKRESGGGGVGGWVWLKRLVDFHREKVNRSTAPKIWSLSVSKPNDKKVIHWALSEMVKAANV